ncbi:DUF937 domain-containing protein [Gulosibacter molinativorax]|uniref:DUF937 domain-containing protein n=1 Tax=Gulosibacter molinativorax TaxID=256821 RepID=A0ABT7CAL6_9MICO|nr:DUF937 domain-containing protein [Gulosibacter molinativorax]MDJ1371686.1 DUF937 domain-containing protein [Gulosibacter molinativorax]QUY63108.1 Hypotetical protein [Gulosibacter molinativorax]
MTDVDAFLNGLPVDQLAQRVGASPEEVERALNDLVPSLVGGMQANAQSPSGAESLNNALSQHVDGATSIDEVDEADGQKITQHIFGGQKDAVVEKVAENSGTDQNLIQKLLPIVAPIILAMLASKMSKRNTPNKDAADQPDAAGTDASGTTSTQSGSEGSLADVLGGILGGGSSSGGLGGILGQLGGLLGGGRK